VGNLPATALAQELEGAIVVARDVPERYAFLPGAGEALTVKTAPFLDVWAGINPGKPIPDAAADAIAAKTTGSTLNTRDLGIDSADAFRLEAGSTGLNPSHAQGSGVGALVGQAVAGGMGSLQSGLGQMQSALRPQ
jgi:hypothetical protein